jgi:hypothetical protein
MGRGPMTDRGAVGGLRHHHPMPVTEPVTTATKDTTLLSHAGVPLTRPTTFRFTLDPTRAQHQMLLVHAGASRMAFNHHLARVKANLEQRAAEKTYGVAAADLTPSLSWSKISFINHMNAWKDGRAVDARPTPRARWLERRLGRAYEWPHLLCSPECGLTCTNMPRGGWTPHVNASPGRLRASSRPHVRHAGDLRKHP